MNKQTPLKPHQTFNKMQFRQVCDQNNQPPPMLLEGHCTFAPDVVEIALLSKRQYTAIIVWNSILRDATRKPVWKTSRSLSAIRAETSLSKPTIMRAHRQLLQAGYIKRVSGGGTSGKPTTFIIPLAKKYREKVSRMQETGDWTL
jgi:hypothetical protein